MLTDGQSTSVPAGATSNVFLGRPIEFLGQPTNVTLLATADAPLQSAQILINIGASQMAPIASGVPLNVAAAAGSGPKNDEDVMATFAVPAGARLQMNVTNNGGAAVINRWRAILS
jgi:hypothetical protein